MKFDDYDIAYFLTIEDNNIEDEAEREKEAIKTNCAYFAFVKINNTLVRAQYCCTMIVKEKEGISLTYAMDYHGSMTLTLEANKNKIDKIWEFTQINDGKNVNLAPSHIVLVAKESKEKEEKE